MFVKSSSAAPAIAEQIRRLKSEFPGKIFAILDSDHSKDHVLAEMKLVRPLLSAGDYLIVEDSMLNGHPVLPGWGPGPYEAIEAYEQEFPNDYTHDSRAGEQIRLDICAQRIPDPQLATGRREIRQPTNAASTRSGTRQLTRALIGEELGDVAAAHLVVRGRTGAVMQQASSIRLYR